MNKKKALITGASSGIGWATALALAESGMDVVLCGRRKDKLEALKKLIKYPSEAEILVFDVADKEMVKQKLEPLASQIDVLVNNAGNAHGLSTIDNGILEDYDAMIDSNLRGLLYVSKAIMPAMVEKKSGHIVNISSVAGKQTYAKGAVYCSTKKAVEAISEGMRLDLTEHGIKITNIAPGAVETEFSVVRFKGDQSKADSIYQGYEPLLAEDIANAIAYAVNAPDHVTIADMTIYAKAQAAPTTIFKK